MALPTFAPMLASTQPPTTGAEWAFEPKVDGWRALIYVDDAVTVRTRTDWKRGHAPRRHR
jgi:ATP-dependent DNA ligase